MRNFLFNCWSCGWWLYVNVSLKFFDYIFVPYLSFFRGHLDLTWLGAPPSIKYPCNKDASVFHYVQVIGWSMWFSEYLFLERIWAKDESILKVWWSKAVSWLFLVLKIFIGLSFVVYLYVCWHISESFFILFQLIWLNFMLFYLQSGLQRLRDYPLPFWLALFVEGTRFTQAKLLAAQEYAVSDGLPVPRNVLIPRTKVELQVHTIQ